MKNIVVPIAGGFEEIELVSVIDILRRAGVRVIVASLDSHLRVLGAHQILIQADSALPSLDMKRFDGIVLAGGLEGMKNLLNNDLVLSWIAYLDSKKSLVSAICASPIVLDKAGVIRGAYTCYPGCETQMKNPKAKVNQAIVCDNHIITSAGPATANVFGLEIVRFLCGESVSKDLANELQIPVLSDYFNKRD